MDQVCHEFDFFKLLELIKTSPNPQFLQYETFSKRFRSLYAFSAPISDRIQLADAGFFFKTRDCVQCWTCGLILGNWIRGDCPYREHAKYSKKCSFILLSKGSKFVNNVNNNFK